VNRRFFLASLSAGAAGLGALQGKRPNVVIALCDDLGYGDIACYGNRTIRTPNLDRFAGEGLRFTSFYAAAPVCSPSRAGLLTGRTPNRLGIYNWIPADNPMYLRHDEATFAKLLQRAGYRTAHVGKWHCNGKFGSPDQPQPDSHGFDHWFSTQNNAAPTHQDPVNFVRNGSPVGPLQGHSSALIVDEAIRWLKSGNQAQPFCLFVCFHSPHEPIATPSEFVNMYPGATKEGEALYYGNVTHTDSEFGRLMKHLDSAGLRENSFVLFTSDNGPETLNRYKGAWRSHGTAKPLRSMKLSMYEGGYRVPGIVRWPGVTKAAHTTDEPACGLDVLPTLCELAGVEARTKPLDGQSLVPMLKGERMQRAKPLHWHYYGAIDHATASLRDGDWKIVGGPKVRPPGAGGQFSPQQHMPIIKDEQLEVFELYNLRSDPAETRDLAASEPARFQELKKHLLAVHREVQAEGVDWRKVT
jgi:arylsulfatase A